MIPNLDIYRTANVLVRRYGEDASAVDATRSGLSGASTHLAACYLCVDLSGMRC